MKTCFLFLILSTFINSSFASEDIFKHFKWAEMPVTWIENKSSPKYQLVVYFGDGALSDESQIVGATSMMFNQLMSGTTRYTQKELSENLEYYGVAQSSTVFHEYSYYAVSGLVKDIIPTLKQICHVFREADFPKNELKKSKKRMLAGLDNLVINRASLSHRVFREVSMKNSPFSEPSSGKKNTIRKINRKHLLSKKEYFNNKVGKKIYITGPKESLIIKEILLSECGWKNSEKSFFRYNDAQNLTGKTNPGLFFLPLKNAKQSHIIYGRYVAENEFFEEELLTLADDILGGGFTSLLYEELRTKTGLVYSPNSALALQKFYGRYLIHGYTKTERTVEYLGVVDKIINDFDKSVTESKYVLARDKASGRLLFELESPAVMLNKVLTLDHLEKNISDIFNFRNKIKSYKKEDVIKVLKDAFSKDKQTILVVGDKSLEKELRKVGKFKKLNYLDFL